MDKVYSSTDAAVEDVPDGAVIAFSAFFAAGSPFELTMALVKKGTKDLTIMVMQVGVANEELLDLVKNGQVKKAACDYHRRRRFSRDGAIKSGLHVAAAEVKLLSGGI